MEVTKTIATMGGETTGRRKGTITAGDKAKFNPRKMMMAGVITMAGA